MKVSAESVAQGVLAYKFTAPVPYAGAIRREGIFQRVAECPTARVILLQGPAGHGKSTALQQLKDAAHAAGHLTGWLTLDTGDNDPRRFLLHIQSLVTSVLSGNGRPVADDIRRSDARLESRSDWLLDLIARLGKPVALFLDEFQALTDKTVLGFLSSLFERAPQELRIFVGSRSLPNVGLARLVVNNRALILRGDDLRFTPHEVERFFALAADLGIDLDEIDAIYRRTEGWPAALQLFRLTLSSPMVRRSLGSETARAPRELAEYLAENVLALQPPRLQEFLLKTSELTRLSGPLCDEVLGGSDSREVLQQLERSGLFLRCVDPQAGWFKYHSLFSSILAEQLRLQSPDTADDIHRRAARWYKDHGHYEEAVHHAIVCREYVAAAEALNPWASQLVADAHLRTVELWCERLPFEEIIARPDLAIKCAYALVFLRRRQKDRPVLEFLTQRAGSGSVLATTEPNAVLSMAAITSDDIPAAWSISERVPLNRYEAEGFAAFELAAVANLRAYCALTAQEFQVAREYLAHARVYNEHVDAAFSRCYTNAVSGVAMLLQGELRDCLASVKGALGEHRTLIDKSFASAALISVYIWASYEANDLDTAETVFAQNHDIISGSMRTDFLTAAYLSMSRVYDARGQHAKAEALLAEAKILGYDSGWLRFVSTVTWERVRRHLAHGDLDQALKTAASARIESKLPGTWIPFANDIEDQELGEIRLALAQGHLEDAAQRLRVALRRQNGRALRKIKLYSLLAVHGARCADESASRRHLHIALRLAQSGGFIRAVLDAGNEVTRLLQAEHQALLANAREPRAASRDLAFVEQLLEVAGVQFVRAPAVKCHAARQSLTDREKELLVLLASGTSNKDVANRLFVSENTVKFHLKNIYAKLSVTSRVRAISAAREIGIIQ